MGSTGHSDSSPCQRNSGLTRARLPSARKKDPLSISEMPRWVGTTPMWWGLAGIEQKAPEGDKVASALTAALLEDGSGPWARRTMGAGQKDIVGPGQEKVGVCVSDLCCPLPVGSG